MVFLYQSDQWGVGVKRVKCQQNIFCGHHLPDLWDKALCRIEFTIVFHIAVLADNRFHRYGENGFLARLYPHRP